MGCRSPALAPRCGVALFVRDGRELHLSDAGAEFLDHAQRIKESCEGAKAAIAEARHDIAGTLTIGSTGEFGTSFTSELLFAFRQQPPHDDKLRVRTRLCSITSPLSSSTHSSLHVSPRSIPIGVVASFVMSEWISSGLSSL